MSSGTRRASLASSVPSDWLLICRSSKKRAQHMSCCNSYKARRRGCPLSRGSSHLDLDRDRRKSLGKFALHLAVIVSSFDPVHIAVVCRRVVIDIAPQFFAVCPGCTEKLLLILLADARATLNQGRDSLILCTTSAFKLFTKNCDHIAVKLVRRLFRESLQECFDFDATRPRPGPAGYPREARFARHFSFAGPRHDDELPVRHGCRRVVRVGGPPGVRDAKPPGDLLAALETVLRTQARCERLTPN